MQKAEEAAKLARERLAAAKKVNATRTREELEQAATLAAEQVKSLEQSGAEPEQVVAARAKMVAARKTLAIRIIDDQRSAARQALIPALEISDGAGRLNEERVNNNLRRNAHWTELEELGLAAQAALAAEDFPEVHKIAAQIMAPPQAPAGSVVAIQ